MTKTVDHTLMKDVKTREQTEKPKMYVTQIKQWVKLHRKIFAQTKSAINFHTSYMTKIVYHDNNDDDDDNDDDNNNNGIKTSSIIPNICLVWYVGWPWKFQPQRQQFKYILVSTKKKAPHKTFTLLCLLIRKVVRNLMQTNWNRMRDKIYLLGISVHSFEIYISLNSFIGNREELQTLDKGEWEQMKWNEKKKQQMTEKEAENTPRLNHPQTYGSNNLFDFQHPNAAYLSWIKRIFMVFLRLSNACQLLKAWSSSSFKFFFHPICDEILHTYIVYVLQSIQTIKHFFNAGAVLQLQLIGYNRTRLVLYTLHLSVICLCMQLNTFIEFSSAFQSLNSSYPCYKSMRKTNIQRRKENTLNKLSAGLWNSRIFLFSTLYLIIYSAILITNCKKNGRRITRRCKSYSFYFHTGCMFMGRWGQRERCMESISIFQKINRISFIFFIIHSFCDKWKRMHGKPNHFNCHKISNNKT